MGAPRKGPDETTLRRWFNQRNPKLTYQDMADRWNADPAHEPIKKAAIATAIMRYEIGRRQVASDLPWKVRPEHTAMHDHCMLMHWASRQKGKKLKARQEAAVNGWLRKLNEEGAVIAYRPNTIQGWWHVKRKPGETGVIRQPPAKVVSIDRRKTA